MSERRHTPARGRSGRRRAFTLVELVLALAVLGLVLTTLLLLRLRAVERVTAVVEERELRLLAQEKLEEKIAEFLSDELDEIAGDFPDRPGWSWEWVDPLLPENIIQEGEEFLLACTVRVRHPNPDDPAGEEKSYELTTWMLPTEDMLLYLQEQQELLMEGDYYGAYGATGGGYDDALGY